MFQYILSIYRAFFTSQNLREHLDSHYNIKKYCCKHCDMKFVNANLLKKHMKVHSDFVCSVCTKRCGNASKLEDHFKREHAVKIKLQVRSMIFY